MLRMVLIIICFFCFWACFANGPYTLAAKASETKSLEEQGHDLMAHNHYSDAIDCFNRALKLRPESQRALAGRGDCYYRAGRYQDALKDLNRAIELNPADGWSYNIRYHTYIELKNYKKAIVDCQKCLQLMSGYRVGQNDLLLLCRKLENDKDSQDFLAKLEKEDPLILSLRLMQRLRFKGAIDALTIVLKKPLPLHSRINALDLRAKCFMSLNNQQKALADYNEIIRLNPESRPIKFLERAEIEACQNKYAEAALDYTKVMNRPHIQHDAVQWTKDELYYKRANCYLKLGEFKKAISDYNSILNMDPSHEEAYKLRGDCHVALGEFQLAVKDYTKAIENDTESPESSYFARSVAYEKMGNKTQAAADRKRALDLGYVPKIAKDKATK